MAKLVWGEDEESCVKQHFWMYTLKKKKKT
jgi:hypothetical protein